MKKRNWSQVEVTILRRYYPDHITRAIADALGRTERQVYQKARALGLRKSDAYLDSPAACRLRRGDNVGKAYRFEKGQTPWNKGKPFKAGGRSAETQFKPGTLSGRAAVVAQPIGAERISKDGYRERKANNDLPFQRRWRAVHIIEWEAVNGPLPDGHMIVFRDGNKQNVSLDNLEMITRAENMRRNSYHRYPKEIALAIQLRGALTRKIRDVEKHQ